MIKKLRPTDGSNAPGAEALEKESGLLLYRVKIGNPRSEALMRLLEEPENVRLMNKAELEMHADQSKKQLYAEKEELFYAIDEKSHDADLTEKGRNFLSPKDPEAFMLPDLISAFHEIDNGDNAPVQRQGYQLSAWQLEGQTKQIRELLAEGLFRESSSAWESRALFPKKLDNT